MATGNMSDGVGHGQHGQAEGQRHPGKPDADRRERCRQHGRSASAEYQPESPEEFR